MINSIVVTFKKKTSCLETDAKIFSEINARMLKLCNIFNFLQDNTGEVWDEWMAQYQPGVDNRSGLGNKYMGVLYSSFTYILISP